MASTISERDRKGNKSVRIYIYKLAVFGLRAAK